MLILSRKKGQNIMIYNDEELLAEVTITAICGNKVKLGFTAPKEITIDREEVFKSKQGMSPREVARFQKGVEDLHHRHNN